MATAILNDAPEETVSLPPNEVDDAHCDLLWAATYARAIESFAAELIEVGGPNADHRLVAIKASAAHVAATAQAAADLMEI